MLNNYLEYLLFLQPRRQRRLYTNDGALIDDDSSETSLIIRRSDEYISNPTFPDIVRVVQPVPSSHSESQLISASIRNEVEKQSRSRDLRPGHKRPITSMVASLYHKSMPATASLNPPEGYVPVYTNQGRVVWQRMPYISRPSAPNPWVLQLPFIRTWNNMRRRQVFDDFMPFVFMPVRGVPGISNQSLDVNIDQQEEEDRNHQALDWDFNLNQNGRLSQIRNRNHYNL